ncbi:MAG TPA: hypothetical protein VKP14_05780 [Gaiellaceae bacterium]|nr:hypothetical protein [Gaiellaceae bacterium]
MATFFEVLAVVFVVVVLAFLAFPLFESSPFAHHADQYRDPRTGKRREGAPRLD